VGIIRKPLQTESDWNPEVVAGRVLTQVLPDSVLHSSQERGYSYILSHPLNALAGNQVLARGLVFQNCFFLTLKHLDVLADRRVQIDTGNANAELSATVALGEQPR
jgi:hypothetical protein